MFTTTDKVLITVLISISIIIYPFTRHWGSRGEVLEVYSGDKLYASFPLDEKREIAVSGELGKSIIVIDEDGARFIDSPCSDKSCVESSYIKSAGEISVCVQNRIMIKVENDGIDEVDLMTR